MADGILSYGDAGRDVGAYDTDTDSPMTLVGEGSVGDAMVIQSGDQVRPQTPGGGGSVGDVSREGVTVDNRIARWHGAGAEVQSSVVSIDDDGNISGYRTLTGGDLGTQLVDTDGLLRILAIGQNGAADRQAMLWDNGGGTWVVDDILEPGAGTLNRMPLWTPDANHLGNSDMSDDGIDTVVLTNDFIVAQGNVEITSGGLGIGVAAPSTGLHFRNNTTATITVEDTSLNGIAEISLVNDTVQWRLRTDSNDGFRLLFTDTSGTTVPIVVDPGTATSQFRIRVTEAIMNDGGGDVDFRVEAVSSPNAFFVQGSSGDVSVGTGDLTAVLGDVNVLAGDVKIGNATTVTPSIFGDDLVVDRGATNAGMTLVSTTGANWIAADAADSLAGQLSFEHIVDEWGFAIGGTRQVTISDGVVTLDAKGKSGRSDIGGTLVKLTNKTGGVTVKGQLVETSTTTAEAFDTAGSNSADVMGIVLEAGVADGEEAWIVEGGIAEVLVDGGGAALHDRLITSIVSGSAVASNNPSNTNHFREIGHGLEARPDAGLIKTAVHFN